MSFRDLRVALVGKHEESGVEHLIEIDDDELLDDVIDHLTDNHPVRFMTLQGGAPVTDDDAAVLLAAITGADLAEIKAARAPAPDLPAQTIQRAGLFEEAATILLPFAGESDQSEGMVDCLKRLVEELEARRGNSRDTSRAEVEQRAQRPAAYEPRRLMPSGLDQTTDQSPKMDSDAAAREPGVQP